MESDDIQGSFLQGLILNLDFGGKGGGAFWKGGGGGRQEMGN